jgi:hypothetical protein
MALNTNIALGVQPIQQPNMLAQYAQVMGIKAAQQEMEGSEDVRRYFSAPADQRGDISQILHTKGGRAASETLSQNAQRQLKMELDALGAAKENVYMAKDPAALAEYMKGVYSSPAGKLLSRFVPVDKALAAIPTDPVAFKEYQKNFGLTAEKIVANATTERGQNMTYGATIRGQNMTDARAREQVEREQAERERIRNIVNSGVTPPATAPVTPMGGDARSSIFVNPASTNVLADQVAPLTATQTPINALLNPPAGQSGAAPVANRVDEIMQQLTLLSKEVNPGSNQAMERLIKELNVINPNRKIEKDANNNLITVNERTGRAEPVLGPDGKPIKGASPYESAFTGEVGKAQAVRNEKVVTAAQAASANIQKIDSAIELLKTGDPTTGFGAELRNNIDRARALFANDIKAGKKVADTQILDALLGSDVFSMIQSLGIGARGLDTPAERDYLRQVMTGTIQMDNKALIRLSEIRRNIETRAIEKYNTQLEKGELNKFFETQGIKPEKIEIPKAAGASSNTVSVGGNTYTFPNAEAAAKFKKDAGIK